MQLNTLLADLNRYSGLQQKKEIQLVGEILSKAKVQADYPNGDDAAAIKTDLGYDLLASEGFLTEFVKQDPWFAGWCGVMVNVSDIAAMGGRPTAVVNAIWGANDDAMQEMLEGMADASSAFEVPIVGGHTNLHCEQANLSVSILGRAKNLLSSFSARPGHALIAAIDLRGEYRAPFLNWNAATSAPPDRLRGDLELLPVVAERSLAVAAKDISQAGLLGTCVMLLESSRVGADIDLKKIPKPNEVSWKDWLCSFPSFGYLLSTPQHNVSELLDAFKQRDIAASHIGDITESRLCKITYEHQSELFWDISNTQLTGMLSHTHPNIDTENKKYA